MSKAKATLTTLKAAVESGDEKKLAKATNDLAALVFSKVGAKPSKAPKSAAAPSKDAADCAALCAEIEAACKAQDAQPAEAAPASHPGPTDPNAPPAEATPADAQPATEPPTVGAPNWSEVFKKLVAIVPAILAIWRDLNPSA
jgi:hypothetical protein